MSRVQMLRAFVNQRLTAAAEEIFELFERTIAEYEQHLHRPQEDGPSATILHGADDQQQGFYEQQNWNPSLDHVDQPHIKEEQKEPWSSPEERQAPHLKETVTTQFVFPPVKSENEERSQASELHHSLTAESEGPAEILLPHLDPDGGYEASHYERVSSESRGSNLTSCFNVLRKSDVSVSDRKSFGCSECGKTFVSKGNLKTHMTCHTGEKPFVCAVCGKRFRQNANMVTHLRIHTAERPFTCAVCNASFTQRGTLRQHARIHTGEKPFGCSVCGKRFTQKGSVTQHMSVHTGEKPFNCSVCGKRFDRPSLIRNHRCVYATDT